MAQDKSNEKSAASMDTELGRLVVEQGLATQAELQECLDIFRTEKERQAGDGGGRTLAEVLVEKGMITEVQVRRVKKTIEASRGQEIPGYQLLAKLGTGAMATVFKARQLSLDRIVAIKVLPRKLSENADYVRMFYKEGKAAAKLNHPNIVQAIDVGEAGGFHYFVMEYVEGHTLWDELRQGLWDVPPAIAEAPDQAGKAEADQVRRQQVKQLFGEAEALDIVIQIARALEHAHSQGLIHRDVKPKNIMIATEGSVRKAKLADMGLARLTADVEAARLEAGRAFGTPYYISPEQIRGDVDVDFRADIYSLGATLYHLMTGRVPFEAETPVGVMQKHLQEPLIPPDHISTNLSAGIGEVVEVMMAKNRNRRYKSTSDLLVDLEAVAQGNAPLQARKQIDGGVLSGLAHAAGSQELVAAGPRLAGNLMLYIILLAAALAISVLLNLVQRFT
ncbi:MAG: serine/threonine-protein kinase [Phycisphaerae bacterium]|jgi:serine/threonine-protein kinase|nr:serine/threonine-protein kinase [Phycisphaerae bacterium]